MKDQNTMKDIYPPNIFKKPPLLKWLYIIRYMFSYPCKKCLVRASCFKTICIELARYLWPYYKWIDRAESFAFSDKSEEDRTFWDILFLLLLTFPILLILCSTGISFKTMRGKNTLEAKRLTNAEVIYFNDYK